MPAPSHVDIHFPNTFPPDASINECTRTHASHPDSRNPKLPPRRFGISSTTCAKCGKPNTSIDIQTFGSRSVPFRVCRPSNQRRISTSFVGAAIWIYHQRFVDGGGGVFSEFEFDSILATWLLSFFASSTLISLFFLVY